MIPSAIRAQCIQAADPCNKMSFDGKYLGSRLWAQLSTEQQPAGMTAGGLRPEAPEGAVEGYTRTMSLAVSAGVPAEKLATTTPAAPPMPSASHQSCRASVS